jgi:hypothetical protein
MGLGVFCRELGLDFPLNLTFHTVHYTFDGFRNVLPRSFIFPAEEMKQMQSSLVRRDQFNISPQGIVHKPTDAAFTPQLGDPRKGTVRLGSLSNKHPNGNGYRPVDVLRLMRELWAEYVAANPGMFKR